MGLHACQMSGEHEIGLMLDAVTGNGARTLGLEGYGLEVGCRADAVLLDAYSVADALRTHPARLAVVRDGHVVAQTAAPGAQGARAETRRRRRLPSAGLPLTRPSDELRVRGRGQPVEAAATQ